MSSISAPTIVRLVRFPTSLRLAKKGAQFFGPLKRSGPVILSERHEPVAVAFRLAAPGITFAAGGTTITGTEAFNEGEQRDLLLPWALVSDGKSRPAKILLEIDVKYEDSQETHTATVPLSLTYVARRRPIGVAAAAAAVVGAAAAVVNKMVSKKKAAPAKKKKAASAKKKAAPAKKKAAPAKKKATPAKKKAAPAKKKALAKKKAPAKKAGGTRRGSAASRSAPRKGARGSSKARKSPSRPAKRKSR